NLNSGTNENDPSCSGELLDPNVDDNGTDEQHNNQHPDVTSRLATLPLSTQKQTWACFSAISNALVSDSGIDIGTLQTVMLLSPLPSRTQTASPSISAKRIEFAGTTKMSSTFDATAVPSTSTTFSPGICPDED
ncbi:unnamed protein product, partial [Didymodactylos carnosus]